MFGITYANTHFINNKSSSLELLIRILIYFGEQKKGKSKTVQLKYSVQFGFELPMWQIALFIALSNLQSFMDKTTYIFESSHMANIMNSIHSLPSLLRCSLMLKLNQLGSLCKQFCNTMLSSEVIWQFRILKTLWRCDSLEPGSAKLSLRSLDI